MINVIVGCHRDNELLCTFLKDKHKNFIFIDSREKGYYLHYLKLLISSTNAIQTKPNVYCNKMANDNIMLFVSEHTLNKCTSNDTLINSLVEPPTLLNLDVEVVYLDKQI